MMDDEDLDAAAFSNFRERFVPANLFSLGGIEQPWPTSLARWRRLLVTAWIVCSNSDGPQPGSIELMAQARAVWDAHVEGLKRPAVVTVVSVLVQLKSLGFVQHFDAVEGGFAVRVVKEAA